MISNNYIELEQETILHTYYRLPIVVEKAFGNIIVDKDGNKYRDYLGGIAVNILGHSHPTIVKAIHEQAEKYLHISNYFYQPIQIEFAKQLIDISGFDKVFFANSGAEANEGAMKLCRLWGILHSKTDIIAFTGGFHGRTFGTLSLMDKPKYKNGMEPFLQNIKIIEFNNNEQLIENINGSTAAIFLEFIQGEGGVIPASNCFIQKLKELKDKYNFLIVADEVQTGMGRTGKMFAYKHWDILPDIITTAKGLGGGLPISALLVSKKIANVMQKGQHGTTFGGNPLACAAGLAVLKELNNGIIENAKIVGKYFIDELNKLKERTKNNSINFIDSCASIVDVRGTGLIIGVEVNIDAQILVNKLLCRHIIANATNTNVIRLLPPLNITKEDVNHFIKEFTAVLKIEKC